jgi:hypothetical protein
MIRDTCFLRWAEGYTPPTPVEFREFVRMHGLTGAVTANLVGVTSRSVRYWLSNNKSRRQIPYAVWRLLLVETGEYYPRRKEIRPGDKVNYHATLEMKRDILCLQKMI